MRDQIEAQRKELNEQIILKNKRIELLENDLVSAKLELGEALNTMHEFEAEHMEYCGAFENNKTKQG